MRNNRLSDKIVRCRTTLCYRRVMKASKRISVRLNVSTHKALLRRAKATGDSESKIVRDAIQDHLAKPPTFVSAGEMMERLGLVGIAKGLPPDLSTNKKYFE